MARVDELTDEIDRAVADVVRQLAGKSVGVPELALSAAAPLRTLPPDLVALIVARTQADATAFGSDHPRTTITSRIVVPSTVLAVVDVVGLITAAATGHVVLAAVAAILLAFLLYLAVAGVRFVRADPLRVSPEQRAFVDSSKTWQSGRPWTDDLRTGPWGRLVVVACAAAGRIAGSDAWTWASLAEHRAETELAPTLDSLDEAAFTLATNAEPVPSSAADTGPAAHLVRRTAALQECADTVDDLVRRAAQAPDLRAVMSRIDAQRVAALLAVARSSGGPT